MRTVVSRCGVLLSLGFLFVAGCTNQTTPMVPVQGVVKINGRSAPNVLITLIPVSTPKGTKPITATAISDANGRFVLKASDGQQGAPAGKHKVTVLDNNLATEEENTQPGARLKQANRIPLNHADAATTPVEIEVVEGKTDYEIDIRIAGQ
jgi:hypothetical protein